MTIEEYLSRHFARTRARVVVRGPRRWQQTRIAIDVESDRSGERFVIGCEGEVAIEVLDVQPRLRHLVLMAREGRDKHKLLLGPDERHWFAAAIAFAMCRPPRRPVCVFRRLMIAPTGRASWGHIQPRGFRRQCRSVNISRCLLERARCTRKICRARIAGQPPRARIAAGNPPRDRSMRADISVAILGPVSDNLTNHTPCSASFT
jgi:hypothetical protein